MSELGSEGFLTNLKREIRTEVMSELKSEGFLTNLKREIKTEVISELESGTDFLKIQMETLAENFSKLEVDVRANLYHFSNRINELRVLFQNLNAQTDVKIAEFSTQLSSSVSEICDIDNDLHTVELTLGI